MWLSKLSNSVSFNKPKPRHLEYEESKQDYKCINLFIKKITWMCSQGEGNNVCGTVHDDMWTATRTNLQQLGLVVGVFWWVLEFTLVLHLCSQVVVATDVGQRSPHSIFKSGHNLLWSEVCDIKGPCAWVEKEDIFVGGGWGVSRPIS